MKKRLIIFDFDGVICDSLEANLAVRRQMNESDDLIEYRKRFEGNIMRNVIEQAAANKTPNRSKEFFEIASHTYHTLPSFPGMSESLKTLAQDYQFAIVSSTLAPMIQKSCAAFDIDHYFSDIMGSDHHIDKTVKFKMLLEKYQLPPEDCIFVTDTLGDVREANAVGIDTIGVLWGFHDRETLDRGTVSHYADSPHALPDLITSHFSQTCSCKKPSE